MPRTRTGRTFPYQAGYPPTWRGRAPGLIPAERTLFYLWLDTAPRGVDAVWYGVPMDGRPDDRPLPPPPAALGDPALARAWWTVNARRCDAILRRGTTFAIVEVRSSADAQTIGELQLYRTLSAGEWPALTFTAPELVCLNITDTARHVLEAGGVKIHQLELRAAAPAQQR